MNAMKRAINSSNSLTPIDIEFVSEPLNGADLSIGIGFNAQSFRAQEIGSAMDPLVMVDHYVMTEPTFGTHPHAGLSAVTLIFSDSKGRFHNRDSLGNDFDLLPGDLYWLKAGRGALHDESPRNDSRIHGLQVFVNVPQEFRHEEPSSLLVRRRDMPTISNNQHSVWVALGKSNGVDGAQSPGLPMTILDGQLINGGSFEHELSHGRNIWIHAIDGNIDVAVMENRKCLRKGQAIAIENSNSGKLITVHISASQCTNAHFALFDGQAIQESFIQKGPFVMGSKDEIEAINNAYNEGRFGSID